MFSVRRTKEGGYIARGVGASIVTESETLDGLKGLVRDAARCHFDPEPEPKTIRLLIVQEEVVVT